MALTHMIGWNNKMPEKYMQTLSSILMFQPVPPIFELLIIVNIYSLHVGRVSGHLLSPHGESVAWIEFFFCV